MQEGDLCTTFGPNLPSIMSEAVDMGVFASSLLIGPGPSAMVTRAASSMSSSPEIFVDMFSRPSEALSDVSVASSSSDTAALVSAGLQLPERVAAAAWGLRQYTFVKRRELDVDLAKMLGIIMEKGDETEEHREASRQGMNAARPVLGLQREGRLTNITNTDPDLPPASSEPATLAEVLQVVGKFIDEGGPKDGLSIRTLRYGDGCTGIMSAWLTQSTQQFDEPLRSDSTMFLKQWP